MYKCKLAQHEYFATDIMADFNLERQFRDYSRAGKLTCSGCGKRVYYKHGDIRNAYFAHKAKTTCDYDQFCKTKQESTNLIEFRKQLIEHILHKYQTSICLEHENVFPKHYCDIMVEKKQTNIYIELFEEYKQPQLFDRINQQYQKRQLPVIWIVCGNYLDIANEMYLNHAKRYLINLDTMLFWDYNTRKFYCSKAYKTVIINKEYPLDAFSIDHLIDGYDEYFQEKVNEYEQQINHQSLNNHSELKKDIIVNQEVYHYYGKGTIIDVNKENNTVTVLFENGSQRIFL